MTNLEFEESRGTCSDNLVNASTNYGVFPQIYLYFNANFPLFPHLSVNTSLTMTIKDHSHKMVDYHMWQLNQSGIADELLDMLCSD